MSQGLCILQSLNYVCSTCMDGNIVDYSVKDVYLKTVLDLAGLLLLRDRRS